MDDREVVSTIATGDPAGLAAAFDKYADRLYAYCRSQLAEPSDAANALQDTFVITASTVAKLREPRRLRAWMFAVARSECRGRAQEEDSAAAGMTYDKGSLKSTPSSREAELRPLVWAAIADLAPAERELIELNLRHKLRAADLADVLGVSRVQARALIMRSRSRFRTLLGLLLAAWPVRAQCPDVAGILDGRDGTLTTPLHERLASHIKQCSVCGEAKGEKFSPAKMLKLLPAAALPDPLRQQVLHPADIASDSADFHASATHRTESFDVNGFPVQMTTPSSSRPQGSYALAACAAVAALALLGAGTAVVDYTTSHSGQPSAIVLPAGAVAAGPGLRFSGPLNPSPSAAPAPPAFVPAAVSPNGPALALSPQDPHSTPVIQPVTSTKPVPTTPVPTTPVPTTPVPTTPVPTTPVPTTPVPTTPVPTTPVPTTPVPTTPVPTTPEPTTPVPTTPEPTTPDPTTSEPTTPASPSSAPATTAVGASVFFQSGNLL